MRIMKSSLEVVEKLNMRRKVTLQRTNLTQKYEIIETEEVSKNNLKTLCLHNGRWDFLSGPIVGHPAQILVPPEECSEVEQVLNSEHISFKVVEKNVQRMLDESKKNEFPRLKEGSISYHKYMTLSEIYAYLDNLGKRYPNLASVQNIGYSTEGRPIKVVKISSGGENKPVIFVDATMHAREWIAPSAALFLIDQLTGNKRNRDLVDDVDWYVIPVVNVDGFEYSHTTDRMWRKTRSDIGHSKCKGVDGNRNFPFHWDGTFESKPCFLTYPGKVPMSEPEVQALINFTETIKDRMKLYVSIHTFGPDLLYPWGYTETPLEDEDDLKSLGDKAVAAVKAASGTNFSCGSIMDLMCEYSLQIIHFHLYLRT
ncbi:carboxypeptidase B [Anabrus simplex]|uniref:carboxypeptidase B n=1 Tax=Anabrus simplex TaxID=316456 RepID=UPI0035A39C54